MNTSLEYAKKLRLSIRTNCYYPDMILKIADNSQTNDFLSISVCWTNSDLSIKWLNKNSESVLLGKQRILRFIHPKSFTPTATKKGAIYSQFLRVARNSDLANLPAALKELTNEYIYLGSKKNYVEVEKKKVEDKYLRTN